MIVLNCLPCCGSVQMCFTGISSIVTLTFWILFTSNTPSTNRYISPRERQFIVNSLKGQISEEAPKVCLSDRIICISEFE